MMDLQVSWGDALTVAGSVIGGGFTSLFLLWKYFMGRLNDIEESFNGKLKADREQADSVVSEIYSTMSDKTGDLHNKIDGKCEALRSSMTERNDMIHKRISQTDQVQREDHRLTHARIDKIFKSEE